MRSQCHWRVFQNESWQCDNIKAKWQPRAKWKETLRPLRISHVRAQNRKHKVNIPKLHRLKEQPKSPRGTNTFCPQLVVSNIVQEKVHGCGQNEFYHILRTITWSSKCCRHGEHVTELPVVIIQREQERERDAGIRKSWIMLAFDLLHLPWHHVNKLWHSLTKVAKQSKIIIHSCLYNEYQHICVKLLHTALQCKDLEYRTYFTEPWCIMGRCEDLALFRVF